MRSVCHYNVVYSQIVWGSCMGSVCHYNVVYSQIAWGCMDGVRVSL